MKEMARKRRARTFDEGAVLRNRKRVVDDGAVDDRFVDDG